MTAPLSHDYWERLTNDDTIVLLDELVTLVHIFDTELDVRVAAIVVLHNGIAYIERIAGLDMVEEIRHVEGDGRNLMIWLVFLKEVQLDVYTAGAYLAGIADVIHALCEEERIVVPGTERLELFEYTEELWSDAGEIKSRVYDDHRGEHLFCDLPTDKSVYTLAEFVEVLLLECKTRSIDVSSEILQQIGAAFDSFIEVKALDASG